MGSKMDFGCRSKLQQIMLVWLPENTKKKKKWHQTNIFCWNFDWHPKSILLPLLVRSEGKLSGLYNSDSSVWRGQAVKMELESTIILTSTSTAYLQNEDEELSADGEFPFQVIIALVQAAIFSIIAYLICANNHLSLCNKVTVTALVLFEIAVLVSGVCLYLGFRDDNTG